ncbi:MAG TPA: hypothetical protein VJG90_09140 [Candidatus Nanoarchaeia archaeon]|nr:hypothetical protein [Candidatus Nanoarchaeia archaeon]
MESLQPPQAPSQNETKDLSRKTLVTLVLLTIVISIMGSFLVLNEMTRTRVLVKEERPAAGNVELMIQYPGTESEPKLQASGATGFVALEIMKNQEADKKMNTAANKKPLNSQIEKKESDDQKFYYENRRGVNDGYFQ